VATPEQIKLKTKDGIDIAGDYYTGSQDSRTGVLMLHMMPATRKSYVSFAGKLQQEGMAGLAIDLRGHGESHGGPNGYQLFSDQDHQKSILDAEAGVEFLKSKGAKKIFIVGASIGANLALQYIVDFLDQDVRAAILLSPGMNYRGIKTDERIKKTHRTKAIYFAAAADDGYSHDTVQTLYDMVPESVKEEVALFDSGGHGTKLFETHPELMEKIIGWMKALL